MATNRELLQRELGRAGQITQSAIGGQGFNPRGGFGVLAAQLATAGIGAFAQKRAKDKLVAQEQEEQLAFGKITGLDPELSRQTSPATRQAILQQVLKQRFAGTPEAQSPLGKLQADISSGLLSQEVGQQAIEKQIAPKKPDSKIELTQGQEASDKAFAKDYIDFQAKGGYSDIQKQLTQLRGVRNSLSDIVSGKSKKDLTGAKFGLIPDRILAFTNPESLSTKQQVEEVVQRNLRLILGAQFTEKEGERLISRAYDERLDEKENLKRVNALINQIDKAARSKASASRYFEEKGTLKGWKGKQASLSDIENAFNKNIKDNKKSLQKDVIDFNDL